MFFIRYTIYKTRNNAKKWKGMKKLMKADIYKLRGKIVERGMTQGELSVALHMSQSTFYRKMKTEGRSFSIGEVHRIVEILGLTQEEASEIFLN